ncbi:MAG: PAS domain S-box protein [Nitrospirae bacterium]|nr:PAS domain S-box protein [Nitrospirota bacterium]
MSEEAYHLLLVEDNPDQVEMVKYRFLKQNPPPKITVVTSGQACLESLSKDQFSAVLLDYSLPGMTGLQVLEEILHRKHDVPVIMVTGRGDETIAVEAMKKGAYDYVVKKSGYEEILPAVVEKAVDRYCLRSRLAQSEERYQRLVECASDVVCLVDLEGKIIMVNPQVEELTGYPPADFVGKPLIDLIHPENRMSFQNSFSEVCNGVPTRLESQILRRDHKTKWVSVSGGPLLENQKVSGAIFILRDISDQKQAEMTLVKRNLDLQLLLEVADTLVSQHDLDQILGIFARQVTQAVMITYSRILLLESGWLIVKAAYPIRELDWETGLGKAFSVGMLPYVQKVLQEKRSVVMTRERFQEAFRTPEQERFLVSNLIGIQSVAMVPLISKGKILGLIVLGERRQWERRPLTENQIALCEAIAQQAAIAVENAHLFHALKVANLDTIKALGGALETKDLNTKGHSDRTVALALAVTRRLGLSEQEQEWAQYTAILHDIGKIGIPESILNKPAKLTPEEFEVMKRHPELGCEIISQIEFLAPVVPLVRADHERWDGRGYPDGLAGEAIPLIARIVGVVDAYDAMTSDRIYRKAPGKAYAIQELKRCAGTQFDPKVVEALLECIGATGS